MLKRLSKAQTIALGFFLIIMTGTLLLMLPISSRSGQVTNFHDALFTATSATCVTGLIVADTYQHWNNFGQVVILALIQTGGLGFITMGVFFSVFLKRRIGLKERNLVQESVNTFDIGGGVRIWYNADRGDRSVDPFSSVSSADGGGKGAVEWRVPCSVSLLQCRL